MPANSRAHLTTAFEAIQAGAPLRGYFAWSLMDNFQWSHGFSNRFGLIHTDYASQQRTIKQSGRWYGREVAEHGV